MGLRRIIKLFEYGNVCVCGLRGRGKDMLTANVVVRRGIPYVSNVDYGGQFIPFDPEVLNCGGNSYKNFITGDVKHYEFPYPDGTDIYLSDVGVYFPAQYCSELNRQYPCIPTYMALSRHTSAANVHTNCQQISRQWDKLREQSDIYLYCNWCKVLFHKLVIQRVTSYELYDSAVKHVPVFRLPKPWLNPDRIFQWKIQKQNYYISHGSIKPLLLIYFNKSNYNTRFFKEVLANGKRY